MTVGHNSFGHTSFEFHSLTPKTSNLTCLIVRMSLILVLQQCPLRILYLVYIYIYGWSWSTNTNLFSKKNNYDYIIRPGHHVHMEREVSETYHSVYLNDLKYIYSCWLLIDELIVV
jgi:hypothetical protein